jgi:hypothetical protein
LCTEERASFHILEVAGLIVDEISLVPSESASSLALLPQFRNSDAGSCWIKLINDSAQRRRRVDRKSSADLKQDVIGAGGGKASDNKKSD